MIKAERLPLRMIALRVIEFLGKVFMIPFIFMMFLLNFTLKGHTIRFDTGIAMCVAFGTFLFSREIGAFNRCFKDCMALIRTKVENPATHHVTDMELYVFNFYRFRIFSRSAAHFHRWKHENDKAYALELEEERERERKAQKQQEADNKLRGKFHLRRDSTGAETSVLPRGLKKTSSQRLRVGEDPDGDDLESANPLYPSKPRVSFVSGTNSDKGSRSTSPRGESPTNGAASVFTGPAASNDRNSVVTSMHEL